MKKVDTKNSKCNVGVKYDSSTVNNSIDNTVNNNNKSSV